MKFNKSIYLFITIFSLGLLNSCKDENFGSIDISSEEGVPVEFEFLFPDCFPVTRAPEKPKLLFSEGDLIHIEGTFTDRNGVETKNYGAMEFKEGKFVQLPGSTLKWSPTVDKGKFKAFFIYGSNGILNYETSTSSVLLSTLKEDKDPLVAESKEFPWGHVIQLQFKHACTYLSIENMEPGVTDQFWFTKDDGNINNAFQLHRSENNDLELQFIQDNKESIDERFYISRTPVNYNIDGSVRTKAGFFLQPGDYSSFKLLNNNNQTYLSFDLISSGSSEEETFSGYLKENIPYTLDVQKSQGVIITEPNEEEWDDTNPGLKINVPEFLKAIATGGSYTNEDGVLILESTFNGTRLLHNVDFENFNRYNEEVLPNFEPNIGTGSVFDGNYHYIFNIGHPVFRYNHGTIQNIGFNKINSEVVSDEQKENSATKDTSRQGGICEWNRSTGTIQNVRVNDVNLTVNILTDNSQETHNAGCLVGSNSGIIDNIKVSGSFTLTVQNDNNTSNMDATVNIGGFVGQNPGIISGITSLETKDLTVLNVYNKCTGIYGAFYMGGAIGFNSSIANEIIIQNVNVDSSESHGMLAYIGGLVGRLATENETIGNSIFSSSTVAGSVKGANSNNTGDNPGSYTGGIGGGIDRVSVIDCRSICNVEGPTVVQEGVVYATGGAFGRILNSQVIENIIAYGSNLKGPKNYIGNFVGLLPVGESWATYENNNIIVKNFNFENIGGNM